MVPFFKTERHRALKARKRMEWVRRCSKDDIDSSAYVLNARFPAGTTRTRPLPRSWTAVQATTLMPISSLPIVAPPTVGLGYAYRLYACKGKNKRENNVKQFDARKKAFRLLMTAFLEMCFFVYKNDVIEKGTDGQTNRKRQTEEMPSSQSCRRIV